jgi:hypothetical protein
MTDNTWYDNAKGLLENDQAKQIRNNLQFSLDANPTQEAGLRQLRDATGIPIESIRENEGSVRTAATLRQFDADGLVQSTPHTARLLTDQDNTKLLHDAIPNTQDVEMAVGLPEPNLGQRISAWLRDRFGVNEAEQARAVIELQARKEGVSVDQFKAGMPGRGEEVLRQFGSKLYHYGSFGLIPDVAGEAQNTSGAIAGAGGALAGFLMGGPIKAADYVMEKAGVEAFEHVAGESFAKALAKDVGVQSAKLGLASGAAAGAALDSPDIGTGLAKIAEATKSGAETGAVFGAAGRLLPGEGILQAIPRFLGVTATLDTAAGKHPFQDLENWDKLTPAQQGDALFNWGLNAIFTARGAGNVTGGWFKDAAKAEISKEDLGKLQLVSQVSAASALRERDPTLFRQFVSDITADKEAPDLYIDAHNLTKAFAQSGVTAADLNKTMPDVARQLDEAAATGGMVCIPMADYATHLAGTEMDAQILPHMRTDPEGMTYHEGQVFFQTQVEQLQAEVAKIITEKVTDGALQLSKEAVHDQVQEQIRATGRVRDEVANAYASLHASFFETLGAKFGISPEEAYAKLGGARIVAEDLGRGFSQGEPGGTGPFGPISTDFKGDAAGAIEHLKAQQDGEATGALYHPEIGDIDLVWGKEGSSRSDGYGLAKLVKYHPEVVDDLQNILSSMIVKTRSDNRVNLESADHRAGVRLTWDGEAKKWLMTAFEKRKEGGPTDTRTDTTGFEGRDDTASPTEASHESVVQKLDKFYQDQKTQRGAYAPAERTISLLKDADLSTFLHESGHFFLDTYDRIARMPDAPAEISRDFQTLMDWFGVPDKDAWSRMSLDQQRESHEKFARGFESYLMEGKAPNVDMASLFARFRTWLLSVYKNLTGLNVNLMPDVRGVMDRMLATEDTIRAAEAVRGFDPLFRSAEAAGMTPEQFSEYQALGADATRQAVTELAAKSIRDMKWLANAKKGALREMQALAAARRKELKEAVTKEVNAQPVERARRFFKYGELDEQPHTNKDRKALDTTAGGSTKLDIDRLKGMYGDGPAAQWRYLARGKNGIAGERGMDPDIAAELFGFKDGRDLVQALLESDPKAKIEGLTDQRMLARYGELSTPEAIERAAEQAIHNEVRGRFVATEFKALSKAAGPAQLIARAAKAAAEYSIAGKVIGALRPAMYTAAEARAAKNAEKAMAGNDVQAAAVEKRSQLLNNQLARAAQTALAEVAKGVSYLKKLDRPSVREKIDVDYRDQIDALLERFDLRKSVTKTDIARRESLASWIEQQAARGLEPNIPEKLLNELEQKHYLQMTVEEFRGLVDAVKSIEHLGRLKNTLRDNARMRDLSEVAQEAVDAMAKLPQHTPDSNRGLTRMQASYVKLRSWGRTAQAGMLKMEQMMDWLDSRNPDGVFNRVVFRRLADAGTRENDLRVKVKAEIDKLLHSTLADVTKDGEKIYVAPGLVDGLTGEPQKFTKKEMLMLAGNMGNESNVAKLIAGEKWPEQAVWDFLDRNMTKADWDFVAGMGRALESLWPEQVAMSRRLGNSTPDKVEPRPFTTRHGDYEGWYWPMIYDPARAQDVAERSAKKGDALFENTYSRANTDTGRLNTRNENYARPLLLELDALPRVIMDNIHDIAFREAIIDADKFLSHAPVRDGIVKALSQEHYDQLRPWLQSIANDGKLGDDGMRALKFFNSLARGARTRATMVGLGYRISTMLVHGASAGMESVAELGTVWFGKGLREFSNPKQWAANRDFIFERSGEMRNRMNEVDRDIREHLREIELRIMNPATGAYARATDGMKAHAYQGIAMLDMASALPTWMGAYLKGMTSKKDGGLEMSEQDAIYFADKTVRNAHGGTGVKDLAAVQRGPEFFKLFSMFYTFWNHNINRIIDTARMAKELPATFRSGDKVQFRGDLGSVVMRTLIYTFGVQIMHHMLHPPKDDAEEQSWFAWAAKEIGLAATAGIPIVRDLAAHYIAGKDYSVTPAASMVDAVGRSGQDIWNASTGDQPVSDKWLKHTITTGGYVFGLPTGQAASTAQFLWDVEQGQQHPEEIADWWRGVVHGDMRQH